LRVARAAAEGSGDEDEVGADALEVPREGGADGLVQGVGRVLGGGGIGLAGCSCGRCWRGGLLKLRRLKKEKGRERG